MDEAWLAALRAGDVEAAWDQFLNRYQPFILATVRHYVQDYDDVMDVFARVCDNLRAERLARLRRYAEKPTSSHTAVFSTWLFVVLRHLIIDWFRQRDGRKQLTAAARALSPLQQRLCEYVFLDGRSHTEAYELLVSRDRCTATFGEFLKELAATYRALERGRRGFLAADLGGPVATPPDNLPDRDLTPEMDACLIETLRTLPADEQAAVQLFVIEEMPAAEVARMVGWPNAKAVYNRVHRALALIRESLDRQGIRRADL
jgi:RNA polymerase sigma factor (sigma-70 family)